MTNFDPNSGEQGQHPYYPAQYTPQDPQQYRQYPSDFGYVPAPAPAVPARPVRPARGRRALMGVGAAALAVALVGGGVAVGRATTDSAPVARQPATGGAQNGQDGQNDQSGGQSGTQNGQNPFGNGSEGLTPGSLFPDEQSPGSNGGGSGSSRSGSGTAASSTQSVGIVTIVSTLSYQNAKSAGTGMIISSDGEVLTNNHVINGATSVQVTDESTGRTYAATVVGTAPTKDVAVLQLTDASGLQTAKVGDASDVTDLQVGSSVAGVGNAGGTGSLTAVTGKVTALEQSITASDEGGTNSERLTGLIETDAAIVSGDSGGPLYDADGEVVGINTAASAGNGSGNGQNQAYAVPVDDALQIADQIEAGIETSSVHIGLPGFIGVGVGDGNSGASVTSVLEDGPAADAGITSGSVITKLDGKTVTGGDSLKTVLASLDPGEKVSVTWTDPSGQSRTERITLATGPAD